MISYLEFTKDHLNFFESLIYFPDYKERLRQNADTTFGFVYFEEKEPLLVALGDQSGDLYYFKMLTQQQNSGLIEVALQHIESHYRQQGIKQVSFQFKSMNADLLSFRIALARRGWSAPTETNQFSIMNWQTFFSCFKDYGNQPDSSRTMVKWADATAQQRHFIEHLEQTGTGGACDRRFHNDTSLVIIENDQPIGWILTEQSATNMMYVRDIFIDTEYRLKKEGFELLSQLRTELLKFSGTEYVMFETQPKNQVMKTITKNRMAKKRSLEKLYFVSTKEL
ncbi:GNAT family N-acetyltransferase [Planococcus salinus]|uniref:GNAT family N-acetyltransferase n=1 Tax=Planococcus salinus TaxID=1848460 RepID=A0A3M8P3H0_9BACL|nr:GNAT family N-acetyltransferase [Planococcus salinus]RNF38258.1 GNAT family N-acetyltransferase [Planococcus salinus]